MERIYFIITKYNVIYRRNENNWLAFYERKRETEKHAHATRLTTIAKSVVTTFGLNIFRLAAFRNAR